MDWFHNIMNHFLLIALLSVPAGALELSSSGSGSVSVNASLSGTGKSASPLGVASSSVAVLTNGFVPNFQIDPSSIAKQGGQATFSVVNTVSVLGPGSGNNNTLNVQAGRNGQSAGGDLNLSGSVGTGSNIDGGDVTLNAYDSDLSGGSTGIGGSIIMTAGRGGSAGSDGIYTFAWGNKGGIERNVILATMTSLGNFSLSGGVVTSSDTTGVLSVSSMAIVGTFVSTQTAGGAGSAVTAVCSKSGTPQGTAFATSGGCVCSGAVAETGYTSSPNCVTTGCIPTGWTCQEVGGTGGACSAYAVCTRLQ